MKKPYIIAEIGINYQGKISLLKKKEDLDYYSASHHLLAFTKNFLGKFLI